MFHRPIRFATGDHDGEGDGDGGLLRGQFILEGDELSYSVEVWDADGLNIERTVAITARASIGYAAYYAAAREHPGRDISLSQRGRILSRWRRRQH